MTSWINSSPNTLLTKLIKFFLMALVISALFYSLYFAKNYFLINTSPSMRLGVYLIEPINDLNRGDIVAVCLDDANKHLALKRGYIASGNRCNGSEPLIKQIIAIPHDNVLLSQNQIIVNGKILRLITLKKDSKGRVLDSISRGNYPDTSGYWLIGTNDAKSWDSRYWGAVKASQVLFKLKPMWLI